MHTFEHNHTALTSVSKVFIAGIVLNSIYVIGQVIVGLRIDSLSLLSDAGHNFADVASLALSLFAIHLNKVKPTKKFTYGYRKTSVIVSLANSIILLVSIGIIGFEAILRIMHPTPMPGLMIAVTAFVGIFINGFSALFFLRDKEKDLNIKSAFLHLVADAVISVGIVIGGIVIYYTHLYWIDSVISIIIVTIILAGTWRLLSDSMKLSLDGVPSTVNIEEIRKSAMQISGIVSIHHLHIWAISTTENALTGHIVLTKDVSIDAEQKIKSILKHELLHQNIQHITIETEREGDFCEGNEC